MNGRYNEILKGSHGLFFLLLSDGMTRYTRYLPRFLTLVHLESTVWHVSSCFNEPTIIGTRFAYCIADSLLITGVPNVHHSFRSVWLDVTRWDEKWIEAVYASSPTDFSKLSERINTEEGSSNNNNNDNNNKMYNQDRNCIFWSWNTALILIIFLPLFPRLDRFIRAPSCYRMWFYLYEG